MPNENDIFRAAIPEPYQVLGLRLRPFSLGHYFILKRHGNAFVADESREVTREDVVFACLVCSMSFDEWGKWSSQGAVTKRQIAREIWRFVTFRSSWLRLCATFSLTQPEFAVLHWGQQVGLFDLKEKAALFQEYLSENSKVPKYWIEKEADKESGTHWAQSVFLTLTGHCGFTREEALDMPLSEALLHFFGYAESQGTVRIMTGEELAMIN